MTFLIRSWVMGRGVVCALKLRSIAMASERPMTMGKARDPDDSLRTMTCWAVFSEMMILLSSIWITVRLRFERWDHHTGARITTQRRLTPLRDQGYDHPEWRTGRSSRSSWRWPCGTR